LDNLIKQDLNIFEYPLYVLTKTNIKENIKIQIEEKEYNLFAGYKTPNSVDMLYLYYFIKILQENNYSRTFSIKQSTIIKEVSKGSSIYYYTRLKETLKIWKNIGLSFKGTFYDGKTYQAIEFGILDYGKVEKNGEVTVSFNEIFLDILQNTVFYRYINFDEFKKLRKPVSRRLYELINKLSLPYKIDAIKLAQKMPLKRLFPSQIIRELKPAIKEINKSTELNIKFSYYKNSLDKTILVFENANKNELIISNEQQTQTLIIPDIQIKKEQYEKLISLLPEIGKTNHNFELIEYFLNKGFDYNYIESNIKYSKNNSNKNFSLYFAKSLENDYAKALREELEIKLLNKQKKQEIIEVKAKEKQEILEAKFQKNQEIADYNQKVNDFIKTLTEEEYSEFKEIAIKIIIREWQNLGYSAIAVKEKIPKPCINEKIYILFGKK
jgi:hypothetical protein